MKYSRRLSCHISQKSQECRHQSKTCNVCRCMIEEPKSHLSLATTEVHALALASGNYHTCVLLVGGGVMCWGMNNYGQLGIGKAINMIKPIAVGRGKMSIYCLL